MPVSVTEPISRAFEKTKEILFKPFDFNKWLGLGFCAFLANLASGGGGGGGGGGNFSGLGGRSAAGKKDPTDFSSAFNGTFNWCSEHMALIIICAAVFVLLVVGLVLLCAWAGSRGEFMFLDGIVHNRGLVKQPWREFKSEGNSLCKFRVCFAFVGMTLTLVVLGICAAAAWSDIRSNSFGVGAVLAILLFVFYVIVMALAGVVINFLLRDFVVPAMYRRRILITEAWQVVKETFSSQKGTVALYFLFLIIVGMGAGMGMAVVTMCTCCIAVIPYVGAVLLLPFFVFLRCYTLYFLEQFGPDWQFFPKIAADDAEQVLPD